jgi:hypothetical protein
MPLGTATGEFYFWLPLPTNLWLAPELSNNMPDIFHFPTNAPAPHDFGLRIKIKPEKTDRHCHQ